MKAKKIAERIKSRREEALERRLEDIATLEGGNIPGERNAVHGTAASRIIEEKLAIAHTDVENLRRKLA